MDNNFDEALNEINSFITLRDTDRCSYAIDFDAVRDFIIEELRSIDTVFDELLNGVQLCGSYADHVKISKPDEYDINILLKLRNFKKAIIIPDDRMPGYVKINITNILNIIETETHNQDIYERLLQLIDCNGFLVQEKISSWFQSMITRVLNECDTFQQGDREYYLTYRIQGPAHNITVYQNGRKLDIDFVPAFLFNKNQWVAERACPNLSKSLYWHWTAIPKPKCNNGRQNISFRASYVERERELINNKNNLKNTLKMTKKLRDCQNITNLKSYYIKTVYLWVNDNKRSNFWNNSQGEILIYMCRQLTECFRKRELPFFWNRSENMIAVLTASQIDAIYDQLNYITNKLINYKQINGNVPYGFYKLFLTRKQIADLDNGGTIIDSMERKYNSNT